MTLVHILFATWHLLSHHAVWNFQALISQEICVLRNFMSRSYLLQSEKWFYIGRALKSIKHTCNTNIIRWNNVNAKTWWLKQWWWRSWYSCWSLESVSAHRGGILLLIWTFHMQIRLCSGSTQCHCHRSYNVASVEFAERKNTDAFSLSPASVPLCSILSPTAIVLWSDTMKIQKCFLQMIETKQEWFGQHFEVFSWIWGALWLGILNEFVTTRRGTWCKWKDWSLNCINKS